MYSRVLAIISFWNYRIPRAIIPWLYCIIFTVVCLQSNIVFYLSFLISSSLRLLIGKVDESHLSVLPIDNILRNLTFSVNRVYHHNGIAYDYYSQNDIGQTKAGNQWKIWPFLNEINQNYPFNHIETSPFVKSNLPFVDVIYVMTDSRLIDRHQNLKKAFLQQGISIESIQWKIKWNYTTCNSNSSHSYVYQRLNLKDKPLNKKQERRCALAMKHVDVWYEMAEEKVRLGLILEDDAIFVPFFKEKFTRMIYAAIDKGILRFNGTCAKSNISNDEWINQNSMIVIGTCFNFHGQSFQSRLANATPVFSTHKSSASRCTHAYLLTSCSAQALVAQIHAQKNDLEPSDFMQNSLFRLSSTLQSFWMDPPLSYQGNQVIDLDNIETFKKTTYE